MLKKTNKEKTATTDTYVTTGLTYDENTTIVKGLSKGDKVIVKGYNQVSNGSFISVKNTNV